MTRILLVEDEERLARSLGVGLRDEDYLVDLARDGEEALWFAGSGNHDLMILDLRIPKVDGWEVCRRLRANGSPVPILMLTACDAKEEIVAGLDLGADDYLPKPFEFSELLARVRALLRRGTMIRSARLQLADLEMDVKARRVWRAGREIALSSMEFRVLEHLLRNAGTVQSRARIAAAVWDDELGPDSNVLEVLVSHLRRKLDRDFQPPLLHTRRGEGYLLSDEAG
ncbi:MAG: response regulator transcription factor [Planctomycetota bacterium]|nr:MAG: response regulator transcription factor [Planctomycetota bacterium]